ncbi:IS3 family transposase [Fictibacillus sp. KU28468]|uniref:IS3 family transposase n=1 Tax=Fictibacillus sp. KU28468 TaxID=2991053 RepID=UPI00223CFEE1|nr:IS3 family transposase [Fictibacillus sp. KU28468]UZJ81207.1 IS3 family transposase [Fictibacillus sp. KU28468]
MCKVLQVSVSGYYKWLCPKNPQKEAYKQEMKQKICQSFHESLGTYGSPRVYQDLLDWGYQVSQKTVGRWMKEMELKATPLEAFMVTTESDHELPEGQFSTFMTAPFPLLVIAFFIH